MLQLLRRLEDSLLRYLQRRCEHPSDMVSSDILEGGALGQAVSYCNRCGAAYIEFATPPTQLARVPQGRQWRLPDPHLWKG